VKKRGKGKQVESRRKRGLVQGRSAGRESKIPPRGKDLGVRLISQEGRSEKNGLKNWAGNIRKVKNGRKFIEKKEG